MTDRHTTPINTRDLTSRLTQIERDTQTPNETTISSSNTPPRPRGPRTPSLDSLATPKFSRSSTMSTTDSCGPDFPQLHVAPAVPLTKANRSSVEIRAGGFSKPRVNKRSRRDASSSATGSEGAGAEDFRYYGRHANQWLFDDFSVTESLKRGWGKVFGKDGGGQDWYEKRE